MSRFQSRPFVEGGHGPLILWQKLVWKAKHMGHLAKASSYQLEIWMREALDSNATRWQDTVGPTTRVLLTARRINWVITDYAQITDERGVVLSLDKYAPKMFAHLVKASVQRHHERKLAAKLGGKFEGLRAQSNGTHLSNRSWPSLLRSKVTRCWLRL